jgi:DNA-binding HxlR family transcriptional regulator/putative sterol carrier protein
MKAHGYQQYCGLARALDVVGDRWTLLVIRELWPGPRRFTDLIEGLPGISRKLLTERLRDLERDGVVARTELPPPAARQVYELTADGRELAAAIRPLVAWGAKRIAERLPGDHFHSRWSAIAMGMLGDKQATKGLHETYQYVVGDHAFHFIVDDGSIEVRDGRADDPQVEITTNEKTWEAIAMGETTPSAALAAGELTIVGDWEAARRLGRIFSRDRMLKRAGQEDKAQMSHA